MTDLKKNHITSENIRKENRKSQSDHSCSFPNISIFQEKYIFSKYFPLVCQTLIVDVSIIKIICSSIGSRPPSENKGNFFYIKKFSERERVVSAACEGGGKINNLVSRFHCVYLNGNAPCENRHCRRLTRQVILLALVISST